MSDSDTNPDNTGELRAWRPGTTAPVNTMADPQPPKPAGNAAWFALHREARRAEKRDQRGKGKR